MNLSSAEGTALLRELSHAILEIQSGIFAILGILLGAWLSRRSELMRLRVERRTQIFDEACRVTAECSLRFGAPIVATTIIPEPHPLEISVTTLDRRMQANFSRAAYTAWRAAYNSDRKIDPAAIDAFTAKMGWSRQRDADARRALEKNAFDEATRKALDALQKEIDT